MTQPLVSDDKGIRKINKMMLLDYADGEAAKEGFFRAEIDIPLDVNNGLYDRVHELLKKENTHKRELVNLLLSQLPLVPVDDTLTEEEKRNAALAKAARHFVAAAFDLEP
jgi:hypothetical protein